MDKHIKEYKEFLKKELKRSKEHSRILEEIDYNLHEMKAIAEYALHNELTKEEINGMNSQLLTLKEAINALEKRLFYIVN